MSEPILRAAKISFSYGVIPVLADVSLTLSAGELLVLIGPNGSGKSTLIRALLGQLRGTGDIVWNGKALSQWSRRELARFAAYLPQSPTHDIGQRVIDVLRLGRAPYWSAFGLESPRDVQVVRTIAARLQMTDLLQRPMDELSGGQRQRVFIGRALVQEPKVLLLDEPNTYLDLKYQVELSTLLRTLASETQVAVIMASHDLNLAGMLADRLLLLDAGSVAAWGTPAEVLKIETLSRVYGVELESVDRGDAAPIVIPRLDRS